MFSDLLFPSLQLLFSGKGHLSLTQISQTNFIQLRIEKNGHLNLISIDLKRNLCPQKSGIPNFKIFPNLNMLITVKYCTSYLEMLQGSQLYS